MSCSSGNNLVLLAASFAMILAEKFTDDEVATLSDFFCAVGDNLSIIATQRDICIGNSSDVGT